MKHLFEDCCFAISWWNLVHSIIASILEGELHWRALLSGGGFQFFGPILSWWCLALLEYFGLICSLEALVKICIWEWGNLFVYILSAMERKDSYAIVSQRVVVDQRCQGIGFNIIFKVYCCLNLFEKNDVDTSKHLFSLYSSSPCTTSALMY